MMPKATVVAVLAVAMFLVGMGLGWCQEGGTEGGLDTQNLTGLLGNLGAMGMMGGLTGGGQSGGATTVTIQQPVALIANNALFVLFQGHITKYDLQSLAKLAESTYPTEVAPQKTVFAPSSAPKVIRSTEGAAAATTPQH
jgi:hypothetical protein